MISSSRKLKSTSLPASYINREQEVAISLGAFQPPLNTTHRTAPKINVRGGQFNRKF